MIINTLFIFTILFLFFLSGYFFLKIINTRIGLFELSSAGFVIGVGLSTYIIFILGLVGVGFSLLNVIFVLVGINLTLFVICKLILKRSLRINIADSLKEIKRLSKLEKLIIIGILYILLSSLLSNLYWPVWIWDAVQLYDYRAKLIAINNTIYYPAESFYDVFYPLMTSVLHAIFYVIDISINPKFIYSIFYGCLILGVYSFVREYTDRKTALVASFVITAYTLIFQQSQFALTNLIHSTFMVFATLYLIRRLVSGDNRYFFSYTILFSLTSFVRNEPMWMPIFILLVILSLFKKVNKSEALYFFITSYLLTSGHVVFKNHYNDLLINNGLTHFSFIGKLLEFIHTFKPSYLWDIVLQVYGAVINNLELPFIIVAVSLFILKFKVPDYLKYLFIYLLYYLIVICFGSFYYRVISTDVEYFALTGSLIRFSLFWKIILLTSLVIIIMNFLFNKSFIQQKLKIRKVKYFRQGNL